jgi:hypothetical protein
MNGAAESWVTGCGEAERTDGIHHGVSTKSNFVDMIAQNVRRKTA